MMSFDALLDKSLLDHLVIFNPAQRINVLYLLSAFVMAVLSYLTFRNDPDGPVKKATLKDYVLGQGAYTHKSALQDYAFAIVNAVVYYAVIAQALAGISTCATIMHQFFISMFGALQEPVLTGPATKIGFTIVSLVLFDLALFWQHYLMHKIPVLWQFHKVHHSAEVLNPITLYRMHPLDLALAALLTGVFGGACYGLFWYLSSSEPQEYLILGLNVAVFLFYIIGYNLRHSQIWFSYPVWVSHIFVSPAQHQIHHSTARPHWDKNMGFIFAFWDKMFGTLYVPKEYEKLNYGINTKEPNPFHSVWDMYVAPFRWIWANRKNPAEWKGFAGVAGTILIAVLFLAVMNQAIARNTLQSVHTEDLTWMEIAKAQHDGYDTIIIPTGGTEQGGPHIVEGKHNFVVYYTAEQIARRLGHTLVAPVLSYVPQGSISKPEYNMQLTGTVNIDEKTFEAMLNDIAESYIHHGFRHIFFIGDHGFNQTGAENVARALGQKYKAKGIDVVQVGDYYSDANDQLKWLEAQGYSKEQIGLHVGMRDTSELMVVKPDGVRGLNLGRNLGENGDYTLSSKSIGRKMLDLKIDAAVRQMAPYLKGEKASVKTVPALMPQKTETKPKTQ